jgi:hypothetical protein
VYHTDDRLASFLFSLVNPWDAPTRRFPLKPEEAQYAMGWNTDDGPIFGRGFDFCVKNDADQEGNGSFAALGTSYYHLYGGDDILGENFFTGENTFVLDEIEVFQCSDRK